MSRPTPLLPTRHRKITHVLAFGLGAERYEELRGTLKGMLQSNDMSWIFTSSGTDVAGSAIERINDREDLEIVLLATKKLSRRYFAEVLEIAAACQQHKTKPWLVLDAENPDLESHLRASGYLVHHGALDAVIHERWVARVDALEREAA